MSVLPKSGLPIGHDIIKFMDA